MDLLDFLFPKRCVGCSRVGSFLCLECIGKLQSVRQICPVCQMGSFLGYTHKYCRNKYALDGLISIYAYRNLVKKVLHRFKYAPYLEGLAPVFTRLIVKNLNKKSFYHFLKEKPPFVPIPLHWFRRHLRGFNQAELLAKNLAGFYHLSSKELLIRTKFTRPQSELNLKQRRINVDRIFRVKRLKLPPKIVLVDDLWTTGATMKSACLVLKRQGVEKVWGLTLAR